MDYLHLKVGEEFKQSLPSESMNILLNGGLPTLIFNFLVTHKDIDNFMNGSASFALFADGSIVFLFRVEGFLDWSDLAFTIHLADGEQVQKGDGYLTFNLMLVDSETHIIKGFRIVTVSPAVRSLLAHITLQQAKAKFDTIDYYKRIASLYEAYPSAKSMLKQALIVEQDGVTFHTLQYRKT